MSEILNGFLQFGLQMMRDMKAEQERRKKVILDEWVKSYDYPRKKKKRVRKRLELKWGIACWDPLGLNELPDL